jgi:hypothetical protein
MCLVVGMFAAMAGRAVRGCWLGGRSAGSLPEGVLDRVTYVEQVLQLRFLALDLSHQRLAVPQQCLARKKRVMRGASALALQ